MKGERQVACAQDVVRRAVVAAQDGAHAGRQLARAEGLGDVVIGAELQPHHLVGLLVAGGEHDDRHARVPAQPTGDLEPVEPRQAEVQDDEIGALGVRPHQRLVAVACGGDGEARPLQVVADELDDLGLVIDDEDACHAGMVVGRAAPAARPHRSWIGIRPCQGLRHPESRRAVRLCHASR